MNHSNWESRDGSFFPLSYPNSTVQASTKGLLKCVVKTYISLVISLKTSLLTLMQENMIFESSAQLTSKPDLN